ncbi:MAG: hypothetical protein DRP50_02105 [Thermotoga sp.]|nr:MAG: hypothetical protein DRP50_02105 [Thermotoga sp.]
MYLHRFVLLPWIHTYHIRYSVSHFQRHNEHVCHQNALLIAQFVS